MVNWMTEHCGGNCNSEQLADLDKVSTMQELRKCKRKLVLKKQMDISSPTKKYQK